MGLTVFVAAVLTWAVAAIATFKWTRSYYRWRSGEVRARFRSPHRLARRRADRTEERIALRTYLREDPDRNRTWFGLSVGSAALFIALVLAGAALAK